jgi:rRNA maturation protein Nop10
MKSDMQGGYLKCPSCGNYTAKFGKNPFKGSEAQGEQEQADDDEP